MNIIDILNFMNEFGARLTQEQSIEAYYYFSDMIDQERLIAIYRNNLVGFITVSLGDDYEKFYHKDLWEVAEHDPKSETVYIEKMVAKNWNKELRRKFETILLAKYPQIKEAVWHRPTRTDDRKVMVRSRLCNLK